MSQGLENQLAPAAGPGCSGPAAREVDSPLATSETWRGRGAQSRAESLRPKPLGPGLVAYRLLQANLSTEEAADRDKHDEQGGP